MQEKVINQFLVEAFNEILKAEEIALSKGYPNLSLREMHVIEAVCQSEDEGINKANVLAKRLKITAGSLTTAVSLLEKKGYLKREKDESDKRIVRISSTQEGKEANEYHKEFHDEMVKEVLKNLSESEANLLIKTLGTITTFFRGKYERRR